MTAKCQNDACEKGMSGDGLLGAKLPGETASTIALASLVNSMPRWILRTPGSLRSFLLSILKKPLDNEVYTSGRDEGGPGCFRLWPIPVPYPEAFTKKGTSVCSWKQRLVNLQVIVLSWLHLGCPYGAPPELRLGRRLSFKQWSVIKMMHHLDYDGNLPLLITAADMGRAAGKFECLEDTLAALCEAVAGLHVENGGYYGDKLTRPSCFNDDWMRSGSLVGHLDRAQAATAKRIVSSRLSFPSEPKFDPVPFFDVATAQVFCFPLQGAKDHREEHGKIPRVKVNASHGEKLLLFRKLAETKRLKPVAAEKLRPPYWSGLFSVGKDSNRDRLILDARPPNMLETVRTSWCQSMAYGASLCDLVLREDSTLVSSGLDLRDFFYQFTIGPERLARNILAGPVSLKDARVVFGDDFDWAEDPVWLGLATLAMGDLNACEFSQAAHLSMMLKKGVVAPNELWTLRNPPPRTLTTVGIIIDDLVVMEQVLTASINDQGGKCESDVRIDRASSAYEEAKLETNTKKSFLKEPLAAFWGIEVDGAVGTIRSSSKRLWPLIAVTFRTARLGVASVKLMEMLAGCWISVLSCRRRMFCLIDIIFEPLGMEDAGGIIRLSEDLKDELMTLAILGPLACSDLRAQFLPYITATDASLEWMAAVRAGVNPETVQEIARYSLKKSTWSRLLPPGKAWLRSHAMLDEDEELPEESFQSHPLYDLVARCFDYKERWRHPCRHGQHINILELKAFLFEEKKICQAALGRRSLCGLDSQVCLGALVKGRSSSPSLNRLLRSSLCYPLGSGVYSYFMYFATQHNRADGPTRGALPAEPDLPEPQFLRKLAEGDCSSFDDWIESLKHPEVPQQLDYDSLLNGTEKDLRPSSRVPGFEKKKNLRFQPCKPLPSFDEVVEEPFGDLCEEAISMLRSFNPNQFFFARGVKSFNRRGGLDLFSGCFGVAKAMVRNGAPWVLTFEWKRSASEDLLKDEVRRKIVRLIELKAFETVGMAPICASFSPAVTPPVRTVRFPRGKPGLSTAMRKKIKEGNSHGDFMLVLIGLCTAYELAFFLENPDGSWLWRQKGYEQYREPSSEDVFRLCYCRMGTPWRKATRIATSTRLAGLRMMCNCSKAHVQLRGYNKAHGKAWTQVAEPYPRGLSLLLARALCERAGWMEKGKLDISGCCRSGTMRIGEATNPGPRHDIRGSLEAMPLLTAATTELEARQLNLFLEWCRSEIREANLNNLFDIVPAFLGQSLRCYGDILFQQYGALSNYRHLVLACQRWKPAARPYLFQAWELVRRWENQEPVSHRTPLPEGIAKAFLVQAWLYQWTEWVGVTLIAFYGAGRIGEIIRCRRGDLILPSDTLGEYCDAAFLQLRTFKSKTRQRAKVQHMKVSNSLAVKLLTMIYKDYPQANYIFTGSAHQYRRRWDFLVKAFGLPLRVKLTPGGIRGGAAVAAYRSGRPISEILWMMRLKNIATLEAYLQETGTMAVLSSIDENTRRRLKAASCLFEFLVCSSLAEKPDGPTSFALP